MAKKITLSRARRRKTEKTYRRWCKEELCCKLPEREIRRIRKVIRQRRGEGTPAGMMGRGLPEDPRERRVAIDELKRLGYEV
jgi:hypothetical protein